jgi:hypothetical protein
MSGQVGAEFPLTEDDSFRTTGPPTMKIPPPRSPATFPLIEDEPFKVTLPLLL